MIKHFLAPILIVTVFVAGHLALAQAEDAPPENAKTKRLGPLAYKLDSRLIPAVKALHAGAATDQSAAKQIKGAHGRALAETVNPDKLFIQIDAIINDALLAQIRATGAEITHSAPQWNTVTASATITQIDALSQLPAIRSIMLQAARRRHQQGPTPNAADALMNADKVRTAFGVSGKNQTVGVLSDSVIDTSAVQGASFTVTGTPPNAFVNGSAPQNTGDLPPTFQLVDPGPGQGTDEGEAMMELIYDIAPGASLAFASAGLSQTSAASNLLALRTAANCNIIVDDTGFIDEPIFQDGPMAQAISTNVSAGAVHFSAFGNGGTNGVLKPYTPSDPSSTADDMADTPTGKDFHNWGIATPTPSFLPIALSSGDQLVVVLEWNQPYSSFNLGKGSQADLDMFLYSTNAIGTPLASATNSQGTLNAPSGDPLEILSYTNQGAAATVFLAVNHFQGVRNNVIWVTFSDSNLDVSFPSGGVNGPTGVGHPSSRDCIGVGAINFQSITAGNLAPESFSSEGGIGASGIPYFFDNSGNLLPNAPVLRSCPDIAAPDGVDTSLLKNFLGTSCAAPNAAAVAALLLEAAPGTSPAMMSSVLQSSARDATGPPASPGPDAFTGAGLVDANAAFKKLVQPPVITSPATASGNVGSFFSYTITATAQGAITFSATNLPPGLSSNGNIISGLPTTAGTFSNFTVSATNSIATVSQIVTVTIGAQLPVSILAQPTATPNPANTGVSVSFSATANSATGLPLSFIWDFGDKSPTVNGNPATHVYASAGSFIATVTVSDGSASVTSNVQVQVVAKPQLVFLSMPAAIPSSAGVGQTVFFLSSAMEGSAALTYSWSFGDGNSGSGATVGHVYTSPGTFTATLTVSDFGGQTLQGTASVTVLAPIVGIGNDSDGDGFSDSFETAFGTDPMDPRSTPLNGVPAIASQVLPLTGAKLAITLNFAKPGSDTITLSGTLPLPAGFSSDQQLVGLDVSGVDMGFTLDAKGKTTPAKTPDNFTLRFKSTKGVAPAQTARFTVKLTKGTFASTLAPAGLTGSVSKTTSVTLVVSIVFNGEIFQSHPVLKFSSHGGKTGTAR